MADSDDNRIARMGTARRPGNPAWGVKGAGRSGNPGGRPKIAKAWDAAIGKGTTEAFAEALKAVWDVMVDGPHPDHNGNHNDPNWRFAVQKVLEYSGGKPKENEDDGEGQNAAAPFDPSSMSDEQISEARGAIATLRKLTLVQMPTEEEAQAAEDDAPSES